VRVTRDVNGGERCVLTIGNFDGVHRGHQAMLRQLETLSAGHEIGARLLTFEPHPVEFLQPQSAPPRLQRMREKMATLSRHRLDVVTCLRFDGDLARMAPDDFIERVLVNGLRVRHLLVGDDFRFGHRGTGDIDTLRRAGLRLGFDVSHMHTVALDGPRVSSTRVRDALATGDLDGAQRLLGWRYAVCGRVRKGQQLGRTIGFPTANIACGRNRFAISGVFAVRARMRDGRALEGVANVGRRPTVGGVEERLEVHFLDLDEDLYGVEFRIELVARIRAERKFDGLDALPAQIARDVASARSALHDSAVNRIPGDRDPGT
jgi:riboflavin kinase/FMN adenylyltransferase